MKQLSSIFSFWPALLFGAVSVWLYLFLPNTFPPAEDACILFRYSESLADSGVIRFNSEGPPVEGATDFLWMVLLSVGVKSGATAYGTARLLSLLSLWGTAALLWHWKKRREGKVSRLQASFLGLALLLNSQSIAAWEGFSLLFFGLACLICWFFFSEKRPKALIVAALVLALIRPDGVIFGGPLVLLLLWDMRRSWREWLTWLLLAGLLPALLYVVWRWQYFDQLFPLPFYVKSSGSSGSLLRPETLAYEIRYLLKYLFPLLGGLILIRLNQRFDWWKNRPSPLRGSTALFPLSVALPLLAYACFSLEQNIADRFMYPIHLAILSWFWLGIGRAGNRVQGAGNREQTCHAELAEASPVSNQSRNREQPSPPLSTGKSHWLVALFPFKKGNGAARKSSQQGAGNKEQTCHAESEFILSGSRRKASPVSNQSRRKAQGAGGERSGERSFWHKHMHRLLCGLATFRKSWGRDYAPASTPPEIPPRLTACKTYLLPLCAAAYLLLSSLYFAVYSKGFLNLSQANPARIAQALAPLPPHRLATTEAGWLPYYSTWVSLDLWGLNSPELAHRAPEFRDFVSFQADLLILDPGYAWTPPDPSATYRTGKSWDHMLHNAWRYARTSEQYELYYLPFARKDTLSLPFPWYSAQIDRIIAWKSRWLGLSFEAPFPLHHAYFLRQECPAYEEIKTILYQHGAISPEAYQQLQAQQQAE